LLLLALAHNLGDLLVGVCFAAGSLSVSQHAAVPLSVKLHNTALYEGALVAVSSRLSDLLVSVWRLVAICESAALLCPTRLCKLHHNSALWEFHTLGRVGCCAPRRPEKGPGARVAASAGVIPPLMSHTVRLLRDSSDHLDGDRRASCLLPHALTVVDVSVIHPAAATYAARDSAGCLPARLRCGTAKAQPLRAGAPWRLLLCALCLWVRYRAHGCACDGAAQHALNPCVCLRDGGQGTSSGGVPCARAQCEPVQGNGTMFRAGLMVTARCSGALSKKATLCLLLVLGVLLLPASSCLSDLLVSVCFAAGSLSVSQRCAAVPFVSVNFAQQQRALLA
jgi:hypothetical protein